MWLVSLTGRYRPSLLENRLVDLVHSLLGKTQVLDPSLGPCLVSTIGPEVELVVVGTVELEIPWGKSILPNPRILLDAVAGLFNEGSESCYQLLIELNEHKTPPRCGLVSFTKSEGDTGDRD